MADSTVVLRNGTVLVHDDQGVDVHPEFNTDVLITDGQIVQIGKDIQYALVDGAVVIDCTDKIVSPGFVDTHHHLWQSQLKGIHADETLLDYFVSGDMQNFNFDVDDTFWGTLAAAIECIDVGTTTVLNHSFCSQSPAHADKALSALITSGLRGLFAYSASNFAIKKWTKHEICPEDEPQPEAMWQHLEHLAKSQPFGNARVTIGMGYDAYSLPDERIKQNFDRAIMAGARSITSHVTRSAIFGSHSTVDILDRTGLLNSTPNLVLSHCNNLSDKEYDILARGSIPVSCTPEAEVQTALGWPLFLQQSPRLNVSIGTDCHSLTPASLLYQVRLGMFAARARSSFPLVARGEYPAAPLGDSQAAFNAITIQGARAMGLSQEIGSLRVGKRGDVTIFDTSSPVMATVARTDPLAAIVRFADVRDISTVIVDGTLRKHDGKILPVTVVDFQSVCGETLSWDDIRRNLLTSQAQVRKRMQGSDHAVGMDFVMSRFGIEKDKIVSL